METNFFRVILGDILAVPLPINQEYFSKDSVARPHEGELHITELLLHSTLPGNLDDIETVYVAAKLDVICFYCNSPTR